MNRDFQYDVAFSFLAQDEAIAIELHDLLEGRLSTFLYSKKQETLAGTDGEKTFGDVFGKHARLVVVLYRSGWGQTPWTRIEETAIRNRAYEHGYDFVKFIPLDEQESVPKWLPRAQLWIGLKRRGLSGAASVIEARAQELGGEERSLQYKVRRRAFLESEKGVQAANEEFVRLRREVKSAITDISTTTSLFNFSLTAIGNEFVIVGHGPGLLVVWRCRSANSLKGSELEVTLWEGHPPLTGFMCFENKKELSIKKFYFDVLPSGEYRWILNDGQRRQFTSADLSDFLLGYCIEETEKWIKHK